MTSSPRTNVLAYPAFASLKRGPSANNPALVAIRLHFAARNRAYGYRPHRGRYFAVPVTAAPRRVPNGKNPALVGLRLRFACGETARAVIGPTGADVLAYPAFASLKRCLLYTSHNFRFQVEKHKSRNLLSYQLQIFGEKSTLRFLPSCFIRLILVLWING